MVNTEEIVENILRKLDSAGRSLSSEQWLERCQRILSGAREHADAAREDVKKSDVRTGDRKL